MRVTTDWNHTTVQAGITAEQSSQRQHRVAGMAAPRAINVCAWLLSSMAISAVNSTPRCPRGAFSGINIKALTFRVYLISGTLAGFAAFVFMMRLGAATPTAGDPLLLQIIAAVVLGGTSLSGGEGGIIRSITGALVVAMLIKSLEILGAQFWDQMIAIGILTGLGSALGAWLGPRRTSEVRRTPVFPDRSSFDQS